MRVLNLFVLVGLSGCILDNWDGDKYVGKADCDPNHFNVSCSVVADTGSPMGDSAADTAPPADTAPIDTSTGDTAPADTGVPCTVMTWFRDSDGDGYGNAGDTFDSCEPSPEGYVSDATDCDDGNATVYPGAPESCDGLDNNCNGSVDENVSGVWYEDNDGDGYGAGSGIDVVCDGSSGNLVDNADDCDDTNAAVNPDLVWYRDADADGYGDATSTTASCAEPAGYVAGSTDCDDASASVNPAASESCNGTDDNCDGVVDPPDATDAATWHQDADGDGYGSETATMVACDQPAGYVADASDCDDAASGNHPGSSEVCDGADNDCNGSVDESDATDAVTWYHDADGDGYGDGSASFLSCTAPLGYVADSSDCDDANAASNPGSVEVCDGLDNDCDGAVDNDATDATVWSLDADGDGYGDDTYVSFLAACAQPAGYVADFSDCDDADASVNPAATEVDGDGLDNNCDGTVDDASVFCCPDADGDGYGAQYPTGCVLEVTGSCETAAADAGTDVTEPDLAYVANHSDCDDGNASVNPGAYDSTHDAVDANCDGSL